jgi:hypothetical protein
MPEPAPITKAFLVAVDKSGKPDKDTRVEVQFNPESLKVTLANQIAQPEGGGNQSGTDGQQFVGAGTMKLAVQVWFDVTVATASAGGAPTDVRRMTQKVAYFMTAKQSTRDKNKFTPPIARFEWGTFRFDGVMESYEETLEFFSPDGQPLRASVSFSLAQQKITEFAFGDGKDKVTPPGASEAGQRPLDATSEGVSVPQMAAAQGKAGEWKRVAAANNIENPRNLPPGQLLDMNPPQVRPNLGAGPTLSPPSPPRPGLGRGGG